VHRKLSTSVPAPVLTPDLRYAQVCVSGVIVLEWTLFPPRTGFAACDFHFESQLSLVRSTNRITIDQHTKKTMHSLRMTHTTRRRTAATNSGSASATGCFRRLILPPAPSKAVVSWPMAPRPAPGTKLEHVFPHPKSRTTNLPRIPSPRATAVKWSGARYVRSWMDAMRGVAMQATMQDRTVL
jgi:hypothetical protein